MTQAALRAGPAMVAAGLCAAALLVSACVAAAVGGAGLGASAVYTASETRTVDQVATDNRIQIHINRQIFDESAGLFVDVRTVVYRRRVLLLGAVEASDDRDLVAQLSRQVEGVREVINEIDVVGAGLVDAAADRVLEKSIQGRLLTERDIASANYRVRVAGRKVLLIGCALDSAELIRVRLIIAEKAPDHVLRDYVKIGAACA
ncbi:MAG: BON domain-containing protein [Alphaproteobacteria bacterium]